MAITVRWGVCLGFAGYCLRRRHALLAPGAVVLPWTEIGTDDWQVL